MADPAITRLPDNLMEDDFLLENSDDDITPTISQPLIQTLQPLSPNTNNTIFDVFRAPTPNPLQTQQPTSTFDEALSKPTAPEN